MDETETREQQKKDVDHTTTIDQPPSSHVLKRESPPIHGIQMHANRAARCPFLCSLYQRSPVEAPFPLRGHFILDSARSDWIAAGTV